MGLRQLIFATAAETDGVGKIEERLKWGQPSYLTESSGSGTTIRIDALKNEPGKYARYLSTARPTLSRNFVSSIRGHFDTKETEVWFSMSNGRFQNRR